MLATVKRWIRSTLGVSSYEANGFLIMLPVMVLMIFSQPLYRKLFTGKEPISIKQAVYSDSIIALTKKQDNPRKDSVVLFLFDPNRATLSELGRLGIPQTVAKRIEQYRQKGGRFKIKKDFAKMYGLDSSLFIALTPFIALPETNIKAENKLAAKAPVHVVQYDLNKADTTDFKSVKGIGAVLASRILKYRESLGGFVNLSQLKEVYGLDSLVLLDLNKFYVADGYTPAKIELNKISETSLDKHPYLSRKHAQAIVTYRMQHGAYHSVEDLRKVKLLSEQVIDKIACYLSFE